LASAFRSRVQSDGGQVGNMSCLKSDLKELNPTKPSAFTGLLNDYSGAAAAYSLRLLDNTYTGDAIVVRRASDNTTQAIGFVNNELDTTSLESFCSGTNGFVTTWYDQSGNGVDATQATASKQPKIVGSGNTLVKGTKPAVEFNGSPYLTSSSFSSSISQTTGFVVFDGAQGDFLFDDIVTLNTNSLYLSSSNQIRLYTNIAPTAIYHSISPNTWPQYAIASFVSDTTNSLIGINNETTAGTIGVATMEGVTLGAAKGGPLPLGGYLQEVIVYGSNKSSDLSGINTNINDFYTIY